MRRAIRLIDRGTDIVLLIFFLLLILIGAYTVYDTMLVYNAAAGEDLRNFRPAGAQDQGWDMSALSEDVVAWLTVEDTDIDYPVMQGRNNTEYLDKDPFGEYSLSGSIFLDYRNASDFSDPYSLIYGHHMAYGYMFGALDRFADKRYFDQHRRGSLRVGDQVYPIRFFACLEADGATEEIFDPGETGGPLEYVREHALIWYEPDGKRLIALTTCKFPTTTERIIVFGVLQE